MMRVLPTRSGLIVGAVATAVTFAALNTGINLIYLLASFLYSVLLFGFLLPLLGLRRATAARRAPDGVFAGENLAVDVTLVNPKRWFAAGSVIVEDSIRRKNSRFKPLAYALRVGPKEQAATSYETRISERGVYEFEGLRLSTTYPLGLFRAARFIPQSGILHVYPRMGVLAHSVQAPFSPAVAAGSGQSNQRGGQQEFFGLREYQTGDSPRLVHWKSSARLSRLMVKEFERDDAQTALIVIDGGEAPQDEERRPLFETAVSLAATLAHRLVMQGRNVTVAAPGRSWRAVENGSRHCLSPTTLRFLAALEPDGPASKAAPAEVRAHAVTLLVTPCERSDATQRLSRLGLAPDRVFSVCDPALARLYRPQKDAARPETNAARPETNAATDAARSSPAPMPLAYLMILLGALGMSLGEEGIPTAFVLAALACAGFWAAERWVGRPLCWPALGNRIVIVGAAYGLAAPLLFHRNAAISSAEYLLACQFALLLMGRVEREIGWVFLITLAEFAVGAIRTVDMSYAVALFALAWGGGISLAVWRVHLDALKAGIPAGTVAKDLPLRKVRLWRNAFWPAALGMALASILFVILPRVEANLLSRTRAETISVTGFSTLVQLGDMGRVIHNSRKVMEVQLYTGTGRNLNVPFHAEGHGLLLRGIALDHYDGRAWSASLGKGKASGGGRPRRAAPAGSVLPIRQVITLEPMDTDVLFCLHPWSQLQLSPGYFPLSDRVSGNLYTRVPRSGYFRYSVTSLVPFRTRLAGQTPSSDVEPVQSVNRCFLQLPNNLSAQIGTLARSIANRASNNGGAASALGRAEAVKAYLQSPANFRYTLDLSHRVRAHTPGKEPVEDFLFTHKSGHCEYFAAAMVVMLRTLGIPARLVNGFRMGEWNDLGEFYTVRQSDAHSWVEAYIEGLGWRTFDPTPEAREEATTVKRLGALFRQLWELAESKWVNHVIGYGQNEQKELLGGVQARLHGLQYWLSQRTFTLLSRPFQWVDAALVAVSGEKDAVRAPGARAPEHGQETPSGIPAARLAIILGFFIIFMLTSVGAVLILKYWACSAIRNGRLGVGGYYRRFLTLTARHGVVKAPSETPWEFAERLKNPPSRRSGAVLDGEAAWRLTEIYTQVRYGGKEATPEDVRAVKRCFGRLTAR